MASGGRGSSGSGGPDATVVSSDSGDKVAAPLDSGDKVAAPCVGVGLVATHVSPDSGDNMPNYIARSCTSLMLPLHQSVVEGQHLLSHQLLSRIQHLHGCPLIPTRLSLHQSVVEGSHFVLARRPRVQLRLCRRTSGAYNAGGTSWIRRDRLSDAWHGTWALGRPGASLK